MRSGTLSLVVLLAACDPAPRSPEPEPPTTTPPAARSDANAARAALGFIRERPLAAPRPFREQSCAQGAFAALSKPERELWLRVVDARLDTRHVLPLRITGRVTEPDLNQLDSVLAGIERPEALPDVLRAVEGLTSSRFVGVHHVIHYVSPKWVVRVGKTRPSWDAGRLDAWFMVHDAKSGEALCGTRLVVTGDASGAPRAVRLRSETRERMQSALGDRLRAATPAALTRIGADLALPSASELALARR
jgi:hypothetical protein